jgi:capsular exopolysaccharide synthesis family protein
LRLQDFLKLLRTRWVTVLFAAVASLTLAILYSVTSTPLYQSATRLYVSTLGKSVSDLYQGNRLSQDRVLSYTELLMGETLAQRTIDKLNLDVSAKSLAARVTATAKPDTILIDVSVLDSSPLRARDIANALSDEFVVMVRELETPVPGDKPDARVIVEQRASIPSAPAIPKTKRNIAAGLFGGLLLGTGLALLRDRLDNTVKNRETLEGITHVGLAGNIPLDKDRRQEAAISFETSNTGISEAFRKLRTNLQFLNVDHPPRVIVITSSSPAEGKTTTAINIALALAEAEFNVVLVDGDMRRPSVDKYLDLIGSVGFSTVLSSGASLSEVLQKSKYPRLSVLTAGASPPNPSELLGSQAARNVISDLREQFDYVIIDSSPLLAVTDGAILATNADGALIMARFGETKRDQLAHAVATLENVGANLLGAVFTMTPSRGDGYYSYNYSGYSEDRARAHSENEIESSASQLAQTDTAALEQLRGES